MAHRTVLRIEVDDQPEHFSSRDCLEMADVELLMDALGDLVRLRQDPVFHSAQGLEHVQAVRVAFTTILEEMKKREARRAANG